MGENFQILSFFSVFSEEEPDLNNELEISVRLAKDCFQV